MVQPNLDRLDIDVVDHRGLLVNSRGIKFCFRFIVDVAVAVHHAQSSYYHGHIDRRDIGVAVLRTIITVLRQTQPQFSSLLDVLIFHAFRMSCCYRKRMPIHSPSYTPFLFKGGGGWSSKLNLSFCNFCVGHSSLSIPGYPHMKKNVQRIRSMEFSKVQGGPWRDNTLFSTFHADHPRNWPQSKVMKSRPHITLNRFRCIQSQLDIKTLFFVSRKNYLRCHFQGYQ